MIGDYYNKQWAGGVQNLYNNQGAALGDFKIGPNRYEFDELKKEVLQMKELLKAAKAYDEKTRQKDCELEEKVKILRAVADAVGVDLDEVFGKKTS